MQEGKRTRKHSVCLGISSVLALIVLVLEIAYIVISYRDASMQSIGAQIGTALGSMLVLPHVFFVLLATIFVIVAFFTNSFAFAITAGVLFSVAGVAMLAWILFVLLNIILTFIGCAFCYRKKEEKREAEEEKRYQKKDTHAPAQQERASFASRHATIREERMPMQNGYVQPINANPYQAPSYLQHPYRNVAMQHDPYAPILAQQPTVHTTPQVMYPMTTPFPEQVNHPYATYQDPSLGYRQQAINEPMQMPLLEQPMSKDAISTGYFDDFGNFHSGNHGGNF